MKEFKTEKERAAYNEGRLDGADEIIELVAEIVRECESNGVTDIARFVIGLTLRPEKYS